MKKRIIAFILCFVLVVSLVPAYAAESRDILYEETIAAKLKELGLFKGVSDTDFDLDREPSRVEALVMLIRVLGKENEALTNSYSHPFTDVPKWADAYVGYAYEEGLTNGVSDTKFGTGNANAQMYLTFTLRSLGYSDTNGADFTYKDPYTLAEQVGILSDRVDTENFWRADAVLISYASLTSTVKDTGKSLAQKLIGAGVFTQSEYNAVNAPVSNHDKELNAEEIYAKCAPAVFYMEVKDVNGTSYGRGSGFFISSSGIAITNFHLIDGASSAIIITSDTETTYNVTGVYDFSVSQDWAVIQVDGTGFSYLTMGSDDTIVGGATIFTIGSPLGLKNTISQGLISNPKRVEGGIEYIQISAAISHGSSGGALINKYGEVIGITAAGYVQGQNLNLAVPLRLVRKYNTETMMTVQQAGTGKKPSSAVRTDVFDYFGKICGEYCNTDDGSGYVYEYDENYRLEIEKVDNTYEVTSIVTLSDGSYISTNIIVTEKLKPFKSISVGIEADGSVMFTAKGEVTTSYYDNSATLTITDFDGYVNVYSALSLSTTNVNNLLFMLDTLYDLLGDGYSIHDLGFVSYYA